ncbi:MAG: glutathione S-transferase N-terminal domain-containing protein [Leptospiraceae bacterium]|nr:glutathione S-transferase N-terminal domain-containing protein [Leptospiraceae bacterium]
MSMKLQLYYFESCPYCRRVLQFMQQNNIQVTMKDILKEPSNRDELIRIGGKSQVPCLVIEGKPLYESLDIIEWFKKNRL